MIVNIKEIKLSIVLGNHNLYQDLKSINLNEKKKEFKKIMFTQYMSKVVYPKKMNKIVWNPLINFSVYK